MLTLPLTASSAFFSDSFIMSIPLGAYVVILSLPVISTSVGLILCFIVSLIALIWILSIGRPSSKASFLADCSKNSCSELYSFAIFSEICLYISSVLIPILPAAISTIFSEFCSFFMSSIFLLFSDSLTRLNDKSMYPFSLFILRTLHTTFFPSFTKSLIFLILPGDTSDMWIKPPLPYSSSSTNTEWYWTLVTVQRTNSPSSGKSCFLKSIFRIYSSTSRILALILLLPPVGSASILPQTKHATLVAVFPNVICSFLHFGHLILMNLLVDSLRFAML